MAYLLTIVAAVAVTLWGVLAHQDGRGFGLSAADASAPPATGAPAVSLPLASRSLLPPYTVTYGFNGGVGNLTKGAHGEPRLRTKAAHGGALRTVSHGRGNAIGFPAPCAESAESSCARAILETTGNVSKLNPGTREISFGASVRMRRDQTSEGANIVQKGYSTSGSEYKLQVDGVAGRPSCVVVGTAAATIYVAKSSVAVDDGSWHVIVCDLLGGTLSMTIDGIVRAARVVPVGLNVENSGELRIGGKGTSVNNDQFNGVLDDVWVTVGP